ncbi:MAG: hypothetical protein ACK57L_06020 [Pseudomonadota bacterium]
MMTSRQATLALAASLAALPVAAQTPAPAPAQGAVQQKVTGPQARYWVSAETGSGVSMAAMQGGGLGAMMGAMMGGSGPRRSLRLELGSVRDANPAEAVHAIPAALGMGAGLNLLGERAAAPPEPVERDFPEPPERGETPKGRLLFFWGCGENVGPGQPVILDFALLSQGVLPPNMRSVSIRASRSGPSYGRDRGYAEWPNRKDGKAVPAAGSLVGEHRVQGGFIPDIRLAVGGGQDFMEPLTLRQSKPASGGQLLEWNRVATALGYFANGMGFKRDAGDGGDIVYWNSSSARLLGGEQLMGFLPPAETERLVRENVVLRPDTTQCQVPRQVTEAAGGELMMLNLNAFGPELNVVHPPRPEDPRVTWEQVYAVKLRLRSYTGAIAGMEGRSRRDARRPEPGQTSQAPAPAQEPGAAPATPGAPAAAEAVKNVLRGILGR